METLGFLRGKKVLDLGCNAGFWALKVIDAGCERVVGIDARQMHIDQAKLVFDLNQIPQDRYHFIKANIFEYDFLQLGSFDIVLCLGLLYHTSKPMELFEIIDLINTDFLVIDTALAMSKGNLIEICHEPTLDDPRMATDHTLVFHPAAQAVKSMVEQFDYKCEMLKPKFDNWAGCEDYKDGYRRGFYCAKKTDINQLFDDTLMKEDVAELEKDNGRNAS